MESVKYTPPKYNKKQKRQLREDWLWFAYKARDEQVYAEYLAYAELMELWV